MITAHLGTDQLDLTDDFSIEIVQVSQLFGFDKLRGPYIASISFDHTERNQNRFNHPNRFELRRGTGAKIYEGLVLRSSGFLLMRGTLELTDQFSGNVYGEIGAIGASQQNKLITDADLPVDQTFNNKTSFDPATDDYCAPELMNVDFFKDIGVTATYKLETDNKIEFEESVMQHYHRTAGYAINVRTGGIVYIPTANLLTDPDSLGEGAYTEKTSVVTPMLYLFPTIEKILKSLKFFLDNSDISDDAELKRLCIYNNFNIVNYAPTTEQVEEFGGTTSLDGQPYVNTWWISYYEQTLAAFNYTSLLPRITLSELLISVQNMLNIVFLFTLEHKYKIIDREDVIKGDAVDDNDYFTGSWILKGKKSSIIKFTMIHDSNDSIFSTYYQDLTERAGDFGEDVADYATLQALVNPAIGELRRVISKHMVYEFNNWTITDESGTEKNVLKWQMVSLDFQPFRYNEVAGATDTLEINTTASTVPLSGTGMVRQMGMCNLRKDTAAGFSLRLIFDQNNLGKNNSANYMLNWRYNKNLIDKRWKNTAKWLANREAVEGYFRFPVNIFANFDLNKKHRTRQGEFIIDRMVTRFTHAGIGETKIEGWKV
jgi:hypothetical protein